MQETVAPVGARSANACPELRCPLRTATSDNPITTITMFPTSAANFSLDGGGNIVGDGAGDPKQVRNRNRPPCSCGVLVLRYLGATTEALNDFSERLHRGVQPIGSAAADDVRNGITENNVAM